LLCFITYTLWHGRIDGIGPFILLGRRLTLTAQYLDFRVAAANDAVYNTSGGSIAFSISPAESSTRLGVEVDVYSWYELNRHLNIGGGYGRLDAGPFLSPLTTGHTYSYPYFAINFKDHGRSNGE
jgi:hypothetical protein